MKGSVGDKVMAKWPGSGLYFHAEIKELDDEEDIAIVLFEDGTTMDVPYKDIKKEEYFFRQKRSKSPARSRRRSKSPGRSPGRKPKSQTVADGKRKRSLSRSRKLPSASSSSSSVDEKVTVTLRNLDPQIVADGVVVATKAKTLVEENTTMTVTDTRYMVTRQRMKAKQVEDNQPVQLQPSMTDHSEHREFGGVMGTFLLYLTTPIIPLLVLLGCNAKSCSIEKINKSIIPCNLKAYYDPVSIAIFFGFLAFNAVIYALPLGHIILGPPTPKGKRLPYRISAMYTLLFTVIAYGAMYYFKVPLTIVHDKLFTLAVTGTVVSYVGSFLVYLKALTVPKEEVNPKANTGSHIYDSFMGHELHPRMGLFDFKLYLYRPSMAGWLVVVMIEMQRAYESNVFMSPQILIVGISQILYIIMEFFWDEDQCPYMFDIKNEGLGFVQFFGELVIVPFVYSMPCRYVLDHPESLSTNCVITSVVLLVVGLLFIVVSGVQKSRFVRNPFDPSLSNLESLPASRPGGHRLLISGLWGIVRHPNYLGEIFVALGWGFACGFTHLLPWWYPVFVTVLLCHRALRADQQSSEKHGHTWKVYCQRVKHRVIPYIF